VARRQSAGRDGQDEEILGQAREDEGRKEVPEGGKTRENGDRGYAYYDCNRTTCARRIRFSGGSRTRCLRFPQSRTYKTLNVKRHRQQRVWNTRACRLSDIIFAVLFSSKVFRCTTTLRTG